MKDRAKIEEMKKNGKISSTQADLLINALKESDNRKNNILSNITLQKEKRNNWKWGFLSISFVCSMILLLLLVVMVQGNRFGRDTEKGLRFFQQAGEFLKMENYEQALYYCDKGAEASPMFLTGRIFQATVYELMYEKTQDTAYHVKSQEILKKVDLLKEKGQSNSSRDGTITFFLLFILILIVASVSIFLLFIYNILVNQEEKVNESWANIETRYQRKLDLIPALIDAGEKYIKHEKDTLIAVTESRTNAQQLLENSEGLSFVKDKDHKEFANKQRQVSTVLKNLFALVEKYPALKSDIHFNTIQKNIEEVEDVINSAREDYNKCVRKYNTYINSFPTNAVAAFCKFMPKAYYEAGGAKK